MLNRVMWMQQESRHRQIQAHDRPADSTVHIKDSTCKQDDCSQGGETQCRGPHLPEDIWCHIYFLLPMRDAARAACVSNVFQRFWRCHPNLDFSMKALGIDKRSCGGDEITRNFTSKVDQILKNRSCIVTKRVEIVFRLYSDQVCNLDRWLQIVVTPGIEELTVQLSTKSGRYYNFPWSVLANESGNSIQYINLSCCAFSSTTGLCLKNLSRLELCDVDITGDQLGSLLHNSFALQRLKLRCCKNISCLKIPFHLQQLEYLEVFDCSLLHVIEIKAQNLYNFQFRSHTQVQLPLGVALQLKKLVMSFPGAVSYVCADFPSSLQYVEALTICSSYEMIDTPVLPSKFLHLKYLSVDLSAAAFPPT
ncbi:putative F-box/LRR-repeat protein At5g38386 [Hordeum vulgare subsp. vulgare]|uniref:putative F-box/LRR-repeat protein At5g38386 n=1 Tax=Hordeum vulgare subsp. vulgare TaxID=112509 RepID=UPI001D1A4569|nr:putative F-box/LRR-repeat protein At5g38386 [Hordeum vulgare subsp. vulgare]